MTLVRIRPRAPLQNSTALQISTESLRFESPPVAEIRALPTCPASCRSPCKREIVSGLRHETMAHKIRTGSHRGPRNGEPSRG